MTTPLDPAPRAAPARALLPAALLALGLAAGGALAGAGVARMRTSDRTVSVRGVSEREARADLAIWPLHIVAADDDLAAANASIARQLATVRTFLSEHGLDENGPGERGRATAGPAATQITLGGIRSASQGSVEILPRDQAPRISEESQLLKIVRVVTTVDYAIRRAGRGRRAGRRELAAAGGPPLGAGWRRAGARGAAPRPRPSRPTSSPRSSPCCRGSPRAGTAARRSRTGRRWRAASGRRARCWPRSG